MLLQWNHFAAVAAFLALQAGLPYSIASDQKETKEPGNSTQNSDFWDGFRQGAMLSSFGQDWLGGVSGLLGPMSSMLQFLGPLRSGSSVTASSVRMYFDSNDDKSCQMFVMTPAFVQPGDLRVSFHPQYRTVSVSYRSEERHEQHDPEKGDRVSSRSISGSSTMGLPERCIASAAVLMSQHAGMVCAEERTSEEPQCMVVFPSRDLLGDYIEEKIVPEDIITKIETGGEVGLTGLSEHQLCLASGFTQQQCEKLGRRPRVASVPAGDHLSGGVPVPIFDVTLGML